MAPGDLRWVDFPASGGHEQAGTRPAIVLQDDDYAADVSVVFVIPVTAQPRNLRFPATIAVEASPTTGLTRSSVALVFQARAVDRGRVREPIGQLDEATLHAVYDALDRLTGRNQMPPPARLPEPPPPTQGERNLEL